MGRPLSVLILEDNKADMLLIKSMIKRHHADHIIFECSTYEQALNIFTNNSIDLIFSDLMIPKKTGMDFVVDVLNLEDNKSEIPIVIFTNSKENSMLKLSLQSVVHRYLQKPVSSEEISEAIDSIPV